MAPWSTVKFEKSNVEPAHRDRDRRVKIVWAGVARDSAEIHDRTVLGVNVQRVDIGELAGVDAAGHAVDRQREVLRGQSGARRPRRRCGPPGRPPGWHS